MTSGGYRAARLVNLVLGVWLVLSAFAWPHSRAQMTNTWLSGLLAVVFELTAFYEPAVRYLTTVLAVWLFVSSWALREASLGTLWNNAFVAIVLFFVSLVPMRTRARDGTY